MFRGEIWVVEDNRDAYVLVGSDHLDHNRSLPPIAWGIPITAEAQPARFTEPFVLALPPTRTGLEFPTWALIARGITPIRRPRLTARIGALTPAALRRLEDAIGLLYEVP